MIRLEVGARHNVDYYQREICEWDVYLLRRPKLVMILVSSNPRREPG